MTSFYIKFKTNNIDREKLRECIEDGLGAEILEMDECKALIGDEA